MFFHLVLFVLVHLLCSKGRSLRCSPGQGNPCCYVVTPLWGRGSRGTMILAPLLADIQSLPALPTIKLGPSGSNSQVVGLCTF